MCRSTWLALVAIPVLGLSGCADLPFLHSQSRYVVFFQPNSAALRAPGRTVIAHAAHAAANNPRAPVTVVGAADSLGNTPDNIKLSNARAAAVAAQLIADGVSSTRVAAEGLGPVGSPPVSEQASRTATITIGR